MNQSGSVFLCPDHGAQFNSAGTWIGGQPTGNMQAYSAVHDSAAGTVTVS